MKYTTTYTETIVKMNFFYLNIAVVNVGSWNTCVKKKIYIGFFCLANVTTVVDHKYDFYIPFNWNNGQNELQLL